MDTTKHTGRSRRATAPRDAHVLTAGAPPVPGPTTAGGPR